MANAFRPDGSYKYPANKEYGKKRTFQHAWLESFHGYAILNCAMVVSVFIVCFLVGINLTYHLASWLVVP